MRGARHAPARSALHRCQRGALCPAAALAAALALVALATLALLAAGCAGAAAHRPGAAVHGETTAAAAAPADSAAARRFTRGVPENVPTALLLAGALDAAGDHAAAFTYYQFAFEQDPTDRAVGQRTVESALRAGQPRVALALLARLQLAHPDDGSLALQRGQILLSMDDFDGALELAQQLEAARPRDEDALRLRAQALVSKGQLTEAAAVLEQLVELHPNDGLLLEQLGALQLRAGNAQEGERRLRQALAEDPARENAAQLLVERLRTTERQDDALSLLEDLVRRTPQQTVHRLALAELYVARERYGEAVDLLMPLQQASQLGWQSQLLLTDLLVRTDRIDEAWGVAQRLLGDGFDGPLVLRMAGEIALERREFETAEQLLTRAVRQDPRSGDALVSLLLARSRRHPALLGGEAQVDAPEKQDFDSMLDQARGLADSTSFRQNYLLGALLRRSGRSGDAVVYLRRAVELAPKDRGALYDLAVALEAQKDYRAAADVLERLVQVDPEDAHVLNFCGYLLAEQGWELERALGLVQKALEKEPDNGAYLDSLGWVYYRLGRYDDALGKLIDASNRLADDPTILEHLGDTLTALRRWADAQRSYERAVKVGADRARLSSKVEEVRSHLPDRP
jgi:tetratricopeptide (TPR) repeat protein